MSWDWFRSADWCPAELAIAPRPINGELLSSWSRRLAAANAVALPQIEACLETLLGNSLKGAIFDYAAPKRWRFAMAALTRVPERCVWVLDLQQHFPAAGREWFLHKSRDPDRILSAFCPECFSEQIANRQPLHLKAEWALTVATRCFRHQLPLCFDCPWCGHEQPVHFTLSSVHCRVCQHDLALRHWSRWRPNPEPLVTSFERACVDALAGKTPPDNWTGGAKPAAFRTLIADLIWMFTTEDLIDPRYGLALVDRVVSARFTPRYRYGSDFELPFFSRSPAAREAVVSSIVQVLLGSQADRALGVCGRGVQRTADFRPFFEILPAVARNRKALWDRIGRWPGEIQDRAGEALRFLEPHRKTPPKRQRSSKTR